MSISFSVIPLLITRRKRSEAPSGAIAALFKLLLPSNSNNEELIISARKDEKDSDFYLIQQIDYFYYEPNHGGWNDCTDLFSLHDHLLRADYPLVIFGRMLSDAQWKETFRAVKKFCEDNRQYLLGLTDDRPQKTYL